MNYFKYNIDQSSVSIMLISLFALLNPCTSAYAQDFSAYNLPNFQSQQQIQSQPSAHPAPLSTMQADQNALALTQQLMRDKSARDAAISKSPQAQKAHEFAAKTMGSPENLELLYILSADIFSEVMRKEQNRAQQSGPKSSSFNSSSSDNIAERLNVVFQNASQDPESFTRSLDSATQQKIKDLSLRIPQPNTNPN